MFLRGNPLPAKFFLASTGTPDNKSCTAVIITGFRELYHITL